MEDAPAAAENAALLRGSKIPADALRRLSHEIGIFLGYPLEDVVPFLRCLQTGSN